MPLPHAIRDLQPRAARAADFTRGLLLEVFPSALDVQAIATQAEWSRDTVEQYCWRCGSSTGPGETTSDGCPNCLSRRLRWQRIVRLGAYAPPLSDWIRAMKFHREWSWGPWLGAHLGQLLRDPLDGAPVALCPVPLHWRRRWWRGFDQARLIARGIANQRNWPILDILRRPRHTYPQSNTPLRRKTANVRDVFRPLPVDLAGWEVWLVDDVKTSGATLSQCAQLLKSLGALRIHVAVAAVADPRTLQNETAPPPR